MPLALGEALLLPWFHLAGSPVTGLELVAALLGLVMVVCNIRVHPAGWPLAMASSALYGWFYWRSALYGQAGLQAVFIAVAGWGWWQWLRGRADDGQALQVRALPRGQRLRVALATLAAWPVLAWALQQGTAHPAPWLDALPTVASLAGTWLLARKHVENWPTWVAVNAFSIVLFVQQRLWVTAGLYTLFLLMALWGWRAWRRLARGLPAPLEARVP